MPGVVRTRVGYAGGTKKDPTYRSLGDHSETLQIDYDPLRITYQDLIDLFWAGHDPTAKSWSRQYRAAIFYHNDAQRKLAMETKSRLQSGLASEIFTDIVPLADFWIAEDYHQKHALQHSYEFMTEFKAVYPAFEDIVASTAAARVNGYLGGYGTLRDLQTELDGYGLSDSAGRHLVDVVKAATRYQCRRAATTGGCRYG